MIGPAVGEDGEDARAGGGRVGPVEEDEVEVRGEGMGEVAELDLEDDGAGAAAVEAEDSRQGAAVGGAGVGGGRH